jgi:hypothetical protein
VSEQNSQLVSSHDAVSRVAHNGRRLGAAVAFTKFSTGYCPPLAPNRTLAAGIFVILGKVKDHLKKFV